MEKLADCVEEADRVGAILNTLVDIAEAEARIVPEDITPVGLAKIVNDSVASYADFAQASNVRVTSTVPDGLLARMDATALFRVLANLLDNAIKYTPAGGKVQIDAERRGSIAEVRVRDTGVGIPAADLPRVWDRLFRSDRSRSQRGMGLGLSLVRAIVEAHGGKVAVESHPGAGTTVLLELPAAATSASLPVPAVSVAP